MDAEDHRQPEVVGAVADLASSDSESIVEVDGLLAVQREQQVLARRDPELAERGRGSDPLGVRVQHLLDRVAGHQRRGSGGSPRGARLSRLRSVYGMQHVAGLVDDPPVDLLRDAVVEAAVARLHVEDRDPHALGDVGRHGAVGVAEDQQPVGLARANTGPAAARIAPDAGGEALALDRRR